MMGNDRFGNGAHAHGVGTEPGERPDFSRGFVAWTGHGYVDPGVKPLFAEPGGTAKFEGDFRIVDGCEIDETGFAVLHFPSQRVLAHKIDMIGQAHHIPGSVFGVDASGSVCQQNRFDAEFGQNADREGDLAHRMALVEMGPATEQQDGDATGVPQNQIAGMSGYPSLGKPGDPGIRNSDRASEGVGERIESAAEENRQTGAEWRVFANTLRSPVNVVADLISMGRHLVCRSVGCVMQLNNDEIRRYSRHLILPEVGLAGQKKICSTSVLCIGAGGLGSPIAMYLAAAGIGKIGLVDFDTVDFSNLQRQIIHGTEDVGRPKSESAKESLHRINPNVEVVLHNTRISSDNALDLIAPYDIVVDGTDNFPTRYLTNDACVLLKKPNVYGSIFRFEGQASVFAPTLGGPCYRCLYPEPPPPGMVPSCAEGGVLGVLPGIVGCIQATEILKLALGAGTSLVGRLVLFNALDMKFRELKLRRDPECPICGDNPTIKELIDYEQFCGIPDQPADPGQHPDEVTVQELKRALDNPNLGIHVLDVRDPDESEISQIAGVPQIPLGVLPDRFTELDPNQTIYIHCKGGGRSMKAVQFLKEQGFKYVKSVKGGINAWSDEVDQTIAKY